MASRPTVVQLPVVLTPRPYKRLQHRYHDEKATTAGAATAAAAAAAAARLRKVARAAFVVLTP